VKQLVQHDWAEEGELKAIDDDVKLEIDQATDACIDEPLPPGESALDAVYVNPAATDPLWFRGLP